MNPGLDLINAIRTRPVLQEIKDCPQVSVQIGNATYGAVQDDGVDNKITMATTRDNLVPLLWFNGLQTETAVWHFSTEPTVHHFVIMPWYNQDSPGWCYAMFMAYENTYRFKHYANPPPTSANVPANGFRADRSITEIIDMLSAILKNNGAWKQYFAANVDNANVTAIHFYKYPKISLFNANASVAVYNG